MSTRTESKPRSTRLEGELAAAARSPFLLVAFAIIVALTIVGVLIVSF